MFCRVELALEVVAEIGVGAPIRGPEEVAGKIGPLEGEPERPGQPHGDHEALAV